MREGDQSFGKQYKCILNSLHPVVIYSRCLHVGFWRPSQKSLGYTLDMSPLHHMATYWQPSYSLWRDKSVTSPSINHVVGCVCQSAQRKASMHWWNMQTPHRWNTIGIWTSSHLVNWGNRSGNRPNSLCYSIAERTAVYRRNRDLCSTVHAAFPFAHSNECLTAATC